MWNYAQDQPVSITNDQRRQYIDMWMSDLVVDSDYATCPNRLVSVSNYSSKQKSDWESYDSTTSSSWLEKKKNGKIPWYVFIYIGSYSGLHNLSKILVQLDFYHDV